MAQAGDGHQALPPRIVQIPSRSNPRKTYRVDVANGRCSCPAWVFNRKFCSHLRAAGWNPNRITPTGHRVVNVRQDPKANFEEAVTFMDEAAASPSTEGNHRKRLLQL
jgi:hypothetical protein